MATTATLTFQTVIEKTASNNGVTIEQVMAMNNSASSPMGTLSENPHPSNSNPMVAGSIKLTTYFGGNINNNQIAAEKYSIKPNFVGLLPCSGPQKGIWYLPIPNSIYVLKFYGPDEYNSQYYNMVYCVPAKQNSGYLTGYQDYTSAVPQAFVAALTKYASTLPNNTESKSTSAVPSASKTKTFGASEATQKVEFSFNFWGNLSGSLSKASTFSFEYSFFPGNVPAQPVMSPTLSSSPISPVPTL